jgi:hypothetical protein
MSEWERNNQALQKWDWRGGARVNLRQISLVEEKLISNINSLHSSARETTLGQQQRPANDAFTLQSIFNCQGNFYNCSEKLLSIYLC